MTDNSLPSTVHSNNLVYFFYVRVYYLFVLYNSFYFWNQTHCFIFKSMLVFRHVGIFHNKSDLVKLCFMK